MGIVLTVLEPPHHPEPNLLAALPPETGRVIDVEPRLVSPRYDMLLVTSRGLVVRDHVSGDFHGVSWANFSLDSHLRQHSRHAVLTLWLAERRPLELAITRRLALNIASIAPVLRLHPTALIDQVVVANESRTIDLRQIPARRHPIGDRPPAALAPALRPEPVPMFDDSSRPAAAPIARRRTGRAIAGAAMLVGAAMFGAVLSTLINGDDHPAASSVRMITSESVGLDWPPLD